MIKKIHIILFLHCIVMAMSGQEVMLESSDLPILIITTENNVNIPDEPKVNAHLGIINNPSPNRNFLTDPYNEYDGHIAIELRGNGTLLGDRNSMGFETRKENGENNNVSLLNFPKENDWILYAPETDKTMMRNVIAYGLANQMGYYATRTAYCEVIVNGEYLGIFVLLEKIKRDKNRVDIEKFDEENTQAPEEGGFIVRIDSWWNEALGWKAEPYVYEDQTREINYQYVYPDHDKITNEQADYIQNVITDFEDAMFNNDIGDLQLAYQDHLDVENAADYIILNELTKNPDAYRLSTFMHKDADAKDSKIKLGPVWDYNFGMGNYCCEYHETHSGWEFENDYWSYPSQVPFWFPKLMQNPAFIEVINNRWKKWREELIQCDYFEQEIEIWSERVAESKERHFTKWPFLGVNVLWEWNAGDTYEDETNLLKDWLCKRIEWMDDNIPKLNTRNLDTTTSVYPNPSKGNFNLKLASDIEGTKKLDIYSISGARIYTEIVPVQIGVNEYPIEQDQLSPGLYIIQVEGETATKFAIY